jgi:hypothetical protein
MRKLIFVHFLTVATLASAYAPAQERNVEYAKVAELDAEGNIYVSSDEGKLIKMAAAGHCIEAKFAVDKQTVGCSVARGTSPEELMQTLRLEIYLKNGQTKIIQTEMPVTEWHFWSDGRQVAVSSQSVNGRERHALYDAASSRLVVELAEPSDEQLLPEWAKGPAQIQDEFVPIGEEHARERTKWIAKVLRQIATIQPGMRREDLLRVFAIEGGLSNRFQRTYVYSECPYIKVNVRFKAANDEAGALKEDPDDIIESISQPYLAFSVSD